MTNLLCLICLLFVSGCSWTNTIWLQPQAPPAPNVELVGSAPGAKTRIAVLETKALKGNDSQGDLLASAVDQARAIGATAIWCPDLKTGAAATEMGITATVPSIDDLEKAATAAKQILDVIKSLILLPFTFASDVKASIVSEKTMLCFAYK